MLIPRELAIDPNPLNILQPPSGEHWLGTDEVGRDIFARLIYASRISLSIGFLAVAVAIMVGTSVGALAGYFGGWLDNVLMRVTDAILSIPALFFLIVLSVTLGPSVRTMIVVIGLLSWMELARIIRANVLSLKRREFVEAAQTMGARSPSASSRRHILPNTLAPIVVAATLGVGNALLTEASVSYLGLGVQPPAAQLGQHALQRAELLLQRAVDHPLPRDHDPDHGALHQLRRGRAARRARPAHEESVVTRKSPVVGADLALRSMRECT